MALLFCSILAPHSVAFAQETEKTIEKIERAFAATKKMSASFNQTVNSKGFGVTGSFYGKLYIEKPNKMRWQYHEPAGRLLIADGKKLWFYDPEENIVRQAELSGILGSASPALFLAGEASLSDLFDIDLAPEKKNATIKKVRLRLIPKKPVENVKAMLLEVAASDHGILALTIVDYLGNINRIDFSDVTEPEAIDPARFKFEPPSGAPVRKITPRKLTQ